MSFLKSFQQVAQKVSSTVTSTLQQAEKTIENAIISANTVNGPSELDSEIPEQGIPPNDGINDELVEFVTHLTDHPRTFLDFPTKEIQSQQQINVNAEWRVKHCFAIIEVKKDFIFKESIIIILLFNFFFFYLYFYLKIARARFRCFEVSISAKENE